MEPADRPPPSPARRELLEAGALVVGFWLHRPRAGPGAAAAADGAALGLPLDSQVDSLPRDPRRRHGHRLFRQGRPRHRPPHRHAADGRRGARRRASTRIELIEGDTALTPEPGPDGGQHRRHARRRPAAPGRGDRARGAAGAWRPSGCSRRPPSSTLADGAVQRGGGRTHRHRRARRRPRLRRSRSNPKAPLKRPGALHAGRQVAAAARTCRPRSPAATSTCTTSRLPGMLHGARAPAAGGRREGRWRSTSRRSRAIARRASGAHRRISSPSSPRTNGRRCARARELKVRWSDSAPLIGHDAVRRLGAAAARSSREETHRQQGRRRADRARWPAPPTRCPRPTTGRCSRMARSARRARSPTSRRRRHGLDGVAGEPSLPQHLRARCVDLPRERCASSTSTAPAATA